MCAIADSQPFDLARLSYCGEPSIPSSCLPNLQDHLHSSFSSCESHSAVTSSHFEFTISALGDKSQDSVHMISW